jgi:uncharacterized protein YndB with AHSA1/START domain
VIRYEVETVVPAPPDETFAELLDVASWRQWMPGVLESAYRSAGPPRPGHRGYAVHQRYGLRVERALEVTVLEAPRRLRFAFAAGPQTIGSETFELAPAGTGTRVRLEVETESPPERRLPPLARRLYRRRDRRMLERLRRRLGG